MRYITNNNQKAKSDIAIVETIGAFIKHHRLEQNKSQEQLAKDAGINRSTVVDFEKGKTSKVITFIQLLRALNLLHIVEQFEIKQEISPIQLAKMELAKRKRASKKKRTKNKPKSTW